MNPFVETALALSLVAVAFWLVRRSLAPGASDMARASALVDEALTVKALGDRREALAKLVEALRVSRLRDERALYEAAVMYRDAGQRPQAILALKRLVHRNPEYPNARETLAELVRPSGERSS